ncbi:hypothetical protein L6452_01222 [Arctium lappa]|uniref:Uncharacterized protein n=1 Tax=Arctium lappa TaxID=4217 RepID=A0ACB9FGX9_ARCLA|nr:hypothetical protein L6452_01222 [Arctium lappa]
MKKTFSLASVSQSISLLVRTLICRKYPFSSLTHIFYLIKTEKIADQKEGEAQRQSWCPIVGAASRGDHPLDIFDRRSKG